MQRCCLAGAPSPTRLLPRLPRLALLLALVPVLLQPPLLLRLGGPPSLLLAAAEHTDSTDGGDDSAPTTCSNVCYEGMVEGTIGTCKDQEYDPGLFRMMTDARTRRLAQSFHGDRTRFVEALQRYHDGGNLTVVIVGGSISAGQGAVDAYPYPKWLGQILSMNLPDSNRVRVHNGAVPGTSSQYMSTCHNVHVPEEADIIFMEYAVNDDEMPMPHMNNQVRRPFERLIRKLLKYPRRPAVALLHAYRWFQIPVETTGTFWSSSERQQMEFGLYYGLPQLSIKACCYHLMVQGKEGFQVKRPRADQHGKLQHENFVDATLKDFAFYFDIVHPDGNTGHRVMGEVAAQLVLDVWAQVASGFKPSAADLEHASAALPLPMLAHNYESTSDKCFTGIAFTRTVISNVGFEWVNEGKNPLLPKWGYVADIPEKEIKFKINTKTSTGREAETVTVELGYLRSYENMGKAGVQCEGGCTCSTWFMDGLHEQHTSQSFLHAFKVSQAEECIISVKVLHETSSGHHKVKLTGIMVSEEPDTNGFQNWAAWDWVALAASKDPNGVFEMNNIARRSLQEAQEASSAELQRQYYDAMAELAASAGSGSGNSV